MPEPLLGRGAPDLLAGASVECVDVAVVGADVDLSVRVRRGAFHRATGCEDPARLAGPSAQGVDVAVPVAGVDETADDER